MFCCLADTDAGSLFTAGQSGAQFGYSLLLLQLVLVPIIFAAQELTIRLAAHTRKGTTACIREHFGPFWAWTATIFLVGECAMAMVSEMSGLSGVAVLWGAEPWQGPIIAAIAIVSIVFLCTYRVIEVIGVIFGLFELSFVVSMFCMQPSPSQMLTGLFTFSFESNYLLLIASNLGASIMPWMIYFQQSAIVARGIRSDKKAAEERAQTLVGSCLTQLVMVATLVTMVASPAITRGSNLSDIDDFVLAMAPVFGDFWAKIVVSLSFLGGSMCAGFIVAITPAWAVCEACGLDGYVALDTPPTQAPLFYGSFLVVVTVGVVILLSGINIVALNVYIELMDALLLPMALSFLLVLASSTLPPGVRLEGAYKWLLGIVFSVVSILGASFGIYGVVADARAHQLKY
jgi:NRAMP (natural resistance-associated macrophage protein)-like metal ion transporter